MEKDACGADMVMRCTNCSIHDATPGALRDPETLNLIGQHGALHTVCAILRNYSDTATIVTSNRRHAACIRQYYHYCLRNLSRYNNAGADLQSLRPPCMKTTSVNNSTVITHAT